MVVFLDEERRGDLTSLTQMGGEGMQWIGAAPFVDTKHIFQNLGDGTYFHSAQLAIQAAVAARVNITYKILYNRTVAMTGGQDAPGSIAVPDMAEILARQGVARVIITSEDKSRYKGKHLPAIAELWDRERIVEAQEKLSVVPGVTVLIHDQQCAAVARRLRKRGDLVEPKTSVIISERVCEGCGDCGAYSNCLSLQPVDTEFGEKTVIDQTSCNKDYSCLHGDCPAFVSVTPKRSRRRARSTRSGAGAPAPDTAALRQPERIIPAEGFRIRMPGVGGTGVVTVSQILARAAALDGLYVSSLDQTGLAQKGGAVISDVHIGTSQATGAGKSTQESLDLYLVFDLLGALAPSAIDAASPTRTVAIVSTTKQATGRMIGRPDLRPPATAALTSEMDKHTRADRNLYLDADAVCRAIFGKTTGANLLMVGVAYQSGALPLTAESLEQAIAANGVDAEANLAAFRWGRCYAARPAQVMAMLPSSAAAALRQRSQEALAGAAGEIGDDELADFARGRAADLKDFQNLAYARSYLSYVSDVARRESAVRPGATTVSWSVARYLYKLMAYKDEYEVARLHLLDDVQRRQQGHDEKPAVTAWHLHPPVLRAMGMKRKIRLKRSARPAFIALRAMKVLRGTAFDPFGYAEIRKVERALVTEYQSSIEQVLSALSDENHELCDRIACLPDAVRGYENVKLRNVAKYHAELAQLLGELGESASVQLAST
jgi:indolepyruvate ferredoxin oxidoreductase